MNTGTGARSNTGEPITTTRVTVILTLLASCLLTSCGGEKEETPNTTVTAAPLPTSAATPPIVAPTTVPLPTPDLAPGQTLLSFDFEDGAPSWDLEAPVWRVDGFGDGNALVGQGHGFARFEGVAEPVSRMEFKFRLEGKGSQINANLFETFATGHTRYFVTFKQGVVSLNRQRGDEFTHLGEEPVPLPLNTVMTATVFVGGGSMDVFIDGEPALGADDPSPPPPGTFSFEAEGSVVVDDVTVVLGDEQKAHPRAPRSPLGYPVGPDVGPFIDGNHVGDLVLGSGQTLTLRTGRYTMVSGNIELQGNARLRIEEDAVLIFDRGDSPLFHWGLNLTDKASLELAGGNIAAQDGLAVIDAFGSSTIEIRNARTRIHLVEASDNSTVRIENSHVVTPSGGGIGLNGAASVEVSNSEVGGIALSVRAGSTLKASGLQTGHIDDFDLKRDLETSGIDYDIRLQNVELIPDTLGEGPFERGWVIYADEKASLEISDSTLRKLVLDFPQTGQPLVVEGLRLNQPTDLTLGNVRLSSVTITGQWGFFLHSNRKGTFVDCQALWFFLYDTAEVILRNSTMNEFDPRDYRGIVTFEDSHWTITGEIIEGNDFVMQGTYDVDMEPSALSWSTSQVTRHYPVQLRDNAGNPVPGTSITARRNGQTQTATTDASGAAILELRFSDPDYTTPWTLSAGAATATQIDFFTTTPIVFTLP